MVRIGRTILCVALSSYVIWSIYFPLPPLQANALFVMLIFVIACLLELKGNGFKRRWFPWQYAGIVIFLICFGYVVANHDSILSRAGMPTDFELILGVLGMAMVIFFVGRTTGWALAIIIVLALGYAFLGELLPMDLGGHTGFSVSRIINNSYLTMNGMFGIVIYIMFKYVFLFSILGKVLEETGALNFIIKLSQAVIGRVIGGPAMVACLASSLVGMVSGSAVANVMVVGTTTIPLMKKFGFKDYVAAGIEAASSTGGQIMPPVMAAAAFLVAEYAHVPYITVAKSAVIPAILYYVAIMASIYAYAKRYDIRGSYSEKLPSIKEALKTPGGLVFIVGILLLIILLVRGMSPMLAALYSTIAMVIVSEIGPTRVTPLKALRIMDKGAQDFINLGVGATGIGIIVGILFLTGIAFRFSDIMTQLSGGNLYVLLFFVMTAAIVLGMGIPTAATYVLLAITAAPAIINFGVPTLIAHLFVFYFATISMITPPVALASMAAANIAKAGYWRTGGIGMLLALTAFIVPFMFVSDQSLVYGGTGFLISFPRALIVVLLFAPVAMSGLKFFTKAILWASGILLILGIKMLTITGIILLVGVVCFELISYMRRIPDKKRRENKGPSR
jgi:TRAP transporter 4TM/12TM fusion protein